MNLNHWSALFKHVIVAHDGEIVVVTYLMLHYGRSQLLQSVSMATSGGQTSWREVESVESVWGPGSFGVQQSGGGRDNNGGHNQSGAGGNWGGRSGSSSSRDSSHSCSGDTWQEALLKSVQK